MPGDKRARGPAQPRAQRAHRLTSAAGVLKAHPDVIAQVLRYIVANAASVALLSKLCAVSRDWRAAAKLVRSDQLWCAPFLAAGAAVLAHLRQIENGLDANKTDVPVTFVQDEVLAEVRAYSLHEDVQVGAFALLGLVLEQAPWRPPAHGTLALQRKVAALVVGSMKALPESAPVRLHGFSALLAIAATPTGLLALRETGGRAQMLLVLAQFQPSPSTLGALGRVMHLPYQAGHSKDVRTAMVEAGVIEALVDVMHRYPADLELQLSCIEFMQPLALFHTSETVGAGGAEALFACMRAFPDSTEVQVGAMGLLLVLEKNHSGRGIDFSPASGGLQVVVASAGRPRDDPAHVGHGDIAYMGVLVAQLVMARLPERTADLLALGLVPLLLRVMQHARAAEHYMLHTCCSVLDSLAARLRFRAAVVRAHVLPQIHAAMAAVPARWELQRDACRVLCNVSFPLGARRRSPVDPGLVSLVLAAMHRSMNPYNPSSQAAALEQGTKALVCFMRSHRNVAAVSEAGAVPVLLEAMRDQFASSLVAANACLALASLALHGNNRAAIHDGGGIERALHVFTEHRAAAVVQAQALVLLSSLVVGRPHTHARFLAAGGVATLTGGLCADLDAESQRKAVRIVCACSP